MTLRSLVLLSLSLLCGSSLAQAPSSLVQPALDKLAQAGSGVDLNKWKGGNGLRVEADSHLASIQKDLQATLPGLLVASDKSPASASASLPLLLNLDALYSVVLRVDLLAKGNAPRDQAEALDRALAALDGARRDLGDRITSSAAASEKQVAQLQATVQQQTAQLASAQQPAPQPPPAPAKKRIVKKKAAAPDPTAPPPPAK